MPAMTDKEKFSQLVDTVSRVAGRVVKLEEKVETLETKLEERTMKLKAAWDEMRIYLAFNSDGPG